MKKESYKTVQKEELLRIIENIDKDFTIKEVYELLKGKVGLTTIYRYVDYLYEKKIVSKSISNNVTVYRYLKKCENDNHFYLKCNKCSKLIHVDCDSISILANHLTLDHGFIMNKDNIIINGICKNCKEGGY